MGFYRRNILIMDTYYCVRIPPDEKVKHRDIRDSPIKRRSSIAIALSQVEGKTIKIINTTQEPKISYRKHKLGRESYYVNDTLVNLLFNLPPIK